MRRAPWMNAAWLVLFCGWLALSPARADEDFFRRQVAPIFERHCVRCHQGDEPKGGLSLQTRETALRGGDSGAVIVAGKPGDSLIVEYVSGDKPAMPKNAAPLKPAEIEAIRQWVAAGATWPKALTLKDKQFDGSAWWSLQPLRTVQVPRVNSPWAFTPIDAFILQKLQEQRLSPSPQADRRTLIRRVTFDLHGLPPAPEDVAAFLADTAPDAYEKLVDRLLSSPRYGERWGRHWLDVVHFGESHGYDKDKPRPNAWPYRDYVIRALNADTPYARFIREQLAGDVLYPEDPQGIVATGFIAAGPWDFVGHVELREGTVDKEITRLLDRDDMVSTAMSTFISLTVHCARCHDHKFDPITQEDYYRLQAVFAGVDRAERAYDEDPERAAVRRSLIAERNVLLPRRQRVLRTMDEVSTPEIQVLDQKLRPLQTELARPPQGTQGSPTNGYHSAIMPTADHNKWVQVDLGRSVSIDEVRLIPARPTDFPDTPGFGFPVRYRVDVSDDAKFAAPENLADHTAADAANPGDQPLVVAAKGKKGRFVRVTATKLWPRTNDYVFALGELQVISASRNVAVGASITALDSIEAGRWSRAHLVDGYSSRARLDGNGHLPDDQREKLEGEARRLLAQREKLVLAELDEATRREFNHVATRFAEVMRKLSALPPQQMVYAATRRFASNGNFSPAPMPRPIHLLHRGNVKAPGRLMQPGALSCVPQLAWDFKLGTASDEGRRRAALAEWIADERNMLTYRSIVNRVWHYHFGRGIVDTPDDFGRMGGQPTHAELLDWLARDFLRSGGSLKRLHRVIVSSAVYRQSSTVRSECAQIDADNRFLWRMNRRRLEAEAVRDAVLLVTGKLDPRMGGPSDQQFFFKDDHSPVYDYTRFDVDSPASFRRSVYRYLVRSVPDPFMECLDCADPSLLTPRRNATLTAQQALALLNNAFTVRQAEHFAERLRAEGADVKQQIGRAYEIALCRAPSPAELRLLSDYAARHGLANACRLLLNSNEFIFVD
jgi:mono/diheme cytochrome c family protein